MGPLPGPQPTEVEGPPAWFWGGVNKRGRGPSLAPLLSPPLTQQTLTPTSTCQGNRPSSLHTQAWMGAGWPPAPGGRS